MSYVDLITAIIMILFVGSVAFYLLPAEQEEQGLDVFLKVIEYPFPEAPRVMDVDVGGKNAYVVELIKIQPHNLVPGRNLSIKARVFPDANNLIEGYELQSGSYLPLLLDNQTYDALITKVRKHE